MSSIAVDTRSLASAAAVLQKVGREAEQHARLVEAAVGQLDLQIKASGLLDRHAAMVCRDIAAQAQSLGQQHGFLVFAAHQYEAAENGVVAASSVLTSEAAKTAAKDAAVDDTQVALETVSNLKEMLLDGLSETIARVVGGSPGYATEALSDLFDALLGLVSLGAADYVFKAMDFAALTALLAEGDVDGAIQMLMSDAQQMVMDMATGQLGIPGIPLGAIQKTIEGFYHLGQALGENNLGGQFVQGFIDGIPIVINRPGEVVGMVVGAAEVVAENVAEVAGETVQAIGSFLFGG